MQQSNRFAFEWLLHPRIIKLCKQLYLDGHFKHAALEAMTQVELALKEVSGVENKFGVNLIANLFGEGKSIKLRVPFGERTQTQAESLFRGAFAYYRNYLAHDGSQVTIATSARILILTNS